MLNSLRRVNLINRSFEVHAFFIGNTFICNARLKLAKNYAKGKQHPDTELSLFENNLLSSSTLLSKILGDILKNVQKKQVYLF